MYMVHAWVIVKRADNKFDVTHKIGNTEETKTYADFEKARDPYIVEVYKYENDVFVNSDHSPVSESKTNYGPWPVPRTRVSSVRRSSRLARRIPVCPFLTEQYDPAKFQSDMICQAEFLKELLDFYSGKEPTQDRQTIRKITLMLYNPPTAPLSRMDVLDLLKNL